MARRARGNVRDHLVDLVQSLFLGGAVAFYVIALRLWQPANEQTLAIWRITALALAIVCSYGLHAMLLAPLNPAGKAP